MRRVRGFSLIELMAVVAILGVLLALAAYALGAATKGARLSGARFNVMNMLASARTTALSKGTDVYVIFANLDSAAAWPETASPRVMVYRDPGFAIRGAPDDIMAQVDATPFNIIDEENGAGQRFGNSGLAFRDALDEVVGPCDLAQLPVYMQVTGLRRTQQSCDLAWCTFCEVQAGSCVGAVRFSPDGTARIITGPDGERGGLIKLVNPDDARKAPACLVISEPSGQTVAIW